MQRKNTLIFKYNQDILGTLFCYAFLAESVQNLQFLLIQQVGTVFNRPIFLFLEVLFFSCARNI